MRYKQEEIRKGLPKVIPLAILLLVLLVPVVVEAAQYYVWGRVYSASPLAEGAVAPANPLNPLPAGHHIIGENLVAQVPRNLVKVRVLTASTGSELGSYMTTYDGGYFVSFTNPAASLQVKFVVEELATSQKLMESQEATTLSPWPANNIYYLLVQESLMEIGSDREFACCPGPAVCPACTCTGIFTRVGKIEVATEVGGVTTRLISETTGRATVPNSGPPPTIAQQLYIEPYQDAPFGGNLYIFGAFTQNLYAPGVYYRIKIDNLDDGTFEYMSAPLEKTKYIVHFTPLTVETDRIQLGPKTIGGTPNCYELTPLSSVSGAMQEFWSFPDLLALWPTSSRSGNYRLTLEIVNLPIGATFCQIPNYTDLKLCLDNVSPVAKILPLDDTAAGTPLADDTPLIYTPGPAVPVPYNLLGSMLGVAANYGPGVNPICSILEFTDPAQHLAFKLSAYHANGYMRYWYFTFKRNNTGYTNIIGKYFNGAAMQDYAGLKITTCTESSVTGFQNKYLYLNTGHVDLGSPDGCGYRFYIEAATRATDGYTYLRWGWDEDIHYLKQ